MRYKPKKYLKMKQIYLLLVIVFLASCSKNNETPSVENWNPHHLNEVQERSVDVLTDYVENNTHPNGKMKMNKIDYMGGLIDDLSMQLFNDFTNLYSNSKSDDGTFAPAYEQIHAMITHYANNPPNIEDTINGYHRAFYHYDESNSENYKEIVSENFDNRYIAFNPSQDEVYGNLIQRAEDELNPSEYNMAKVRTFPHLVNHNLFESGAWDDIKAIVNGGEKFIVTCAIAVGLGAEVTMAGIAAVTTAEIGGGVAIAEVATANNKNNELFPKSLDGNNFAFLCQLNQVIGSAAATVDLVMNHTTE